MYELQTHLFCVKSYDENGFLFHLLVLPGICCESLAWLLTQCNAVAMTTPGFTCLQFIPLEASRCVELRMTRFASKDLTLSRFR